MIYTQLNGIKLSYLMLTIFRQFYFFARSFMVALSIGAVEYTDWFSAEG